jgi:hypothetical protein
MNCILGMPKKKAAHFRRSESANFHLLPSDDIYSTTNEIACFIFYMYVYTFQGSAPVEVASLIYRGKLN